MTSKLNKTLIVLTGPTAVGKTQTSIYVAKKLNTEIISADSRQFYKELKIGTATPTKDDLNEVKHHFVGHLSIDNYYNVYAFEKDALKVINTLFKYKDFVILTGGSGLYIDAVCNGIDILPDIDQETRNKVKEIHKMEGIEGLRIILKTFDPEYYNTVDLANPNRIMRAIETFMAEGQKLSQLHKQKTRANRSFNIKYIILNRSREELFERINKRTTEMINNGLIDEAKELLPYKHCNALNTVGYKELFNYFQKVYNLDTAIEKIKTNTRRYAKRQITWFKKYSNAYWIHPDNLDEIIKVIKD